MKIIRAHGGKAELERLDGGRWYYRAHVTRKDIPFSKSGEGNVATMQEARRRAIRILTPFEKR